MCLTGSRGKKVFRPFPARVTRSRSGREESFDEERVEQTTKPKKLFQAEIERKRQMRATTKIDQELFSSNDLAEEEDDVLGDMLELPLHDTKKAARSLFG